MKISQNVYEFNAFAIFSTKWQNLTLDFCILTGFENMVSMIKLQQCSLGSIDTKQRFQFPSTTDHGSHCIGVCHFEVLSDHSEGLSFSSTG